MQIRDPSARIHHRNTGAVLVIGFDICHKPIFCVFWETENFRKDITESVVWVGAKISEFISVICKEACKIGSYTVAEYDRVRNLHHRGLQMEREKHTLSFGVLDRCAVEINQGALADERGIEHFTGHQGQRFFQHRYRSVRCNVFDSRHRRCLERGRFLVMEEIMPGHSRNVRPGIFGPLAHSRRIRPRKVFDRVRRATVGVALTQHRVHGAAHRLVVA